LGGVVDEQHGYACLPAQHSCLTMFM